MIRSFIDETINELDKGVVELKTMWEGFKNGDMPKTVFKERYEEILLNIMDRIDNESDDANNGCSFMDTNPDVEYFVKNKY